MTNCRKNNPLKCQNAQNDKVQNNSVSKDYFTKYFKANIPKKFFE